VNSELSVVVPYLKVAGVTCDEESPIMLRVPIAVGAINLGVPEPPENVSRVAVIFMVPFWLSANEMPVILKLTCALVVAANVLYSSNVANTLVAAVLYSVFANMLEYVILHELAD